MARCLITGHMGYIGSRLYQRLKDEGHEVMGADLRADKAEECLDIRKHLFFRHKPWPKFKPEYIFHLAAQPSVQWSIENPSTALSHNVHGSSAVLDFARHVDAKRVIFASSAAVYGASSPYGLHKLMTEMECSLYAKLYGVDTVSLRYFNVYSEDQKYGGSYSTVIAAWMEMLRRNQPLRLDGDGTQTRDFIYLDDVIDANIFCMNHEDKMAGLSFDVGTGTETSLNEVRDIVSQYCEPEWHNAKSRLGDIQFSKANTEVLESLGWKAKVNIVEGLKTCFGGNNE